MIKVHIQHQPQEDGKGMENAFAFGIGCNYRGLKIVTSFSSKVFSKLEKEKKVFSVWLSLYKKFIGDDKR